MKRDELIALGVAEDAVDKIMSINGADIEKHKKIAEDAKRQIEEANAAAKQANEQLEKANKQIESFGAKESSFEEIKKQADEWKAAAEKAKADSEATISGMKLDYALDNALRDAKAKDSKLIKALLDTGKLKLSDKGLDGLEDQLNPLKESHAYLFEADTPAQKQIPTGTKIVQPNTPPAESAPQNLGEALRQKYKKD